MLHQLVPAAIRLWALVVGATRTLVVSAVTRVSPWTRTGACYSPLWGTSCRKFTHPGTEVLLSAYSWGDRILIDVEDHGDGLPSSSEDKMFEPFMQGGADKSGMGFGLSIARCSVEANHGILRARNKANSGCVFAVDLPRYLMPVTGAA